ncbi:hypothetical protein HYZ98_03675 [Candidatus Peregrinibacteria bacterium]|nr:hypothetical protein [Candidatus Peregrinibacteria bacterium]
MNPLVTLSIGSTYLLLLGFGIFMLLATYLFAWWQKSTSVENFLVAERRVNWFLGGSSIAASWIWAPAVFVSTLFAYQYGLAGLFWFTVPNMAALAIFALLAPRIRKKMPYGYTLPQWIRHKFHDESVHKLYLYPFFFYQLMSITVQLYAGGNLLALLLGIPVYQATAVVTIAMLAAIPLIYSLVSGLESSVITDFLQLAFIIIALIILIPWAVSIAGIDSIRAGLSGLSGSKNIFDPSIAFSLGIVTSIGLIAGSVSDQQYWQRAFAIKEGHLRKAFVFGALAFGLVPILLGFLGFIGADPSFAATVPSGVDTSLIGVVVVGRLLPLWTVFFFVLMLLCALSSTLDSGMNAAASLWTTDVMKYTKEERDLMLNYEKGQKLSDREKLQKHLLDMRRLSGARNTMVWLTITGFLVALAVIYIPGFELKQLWWVFNTVAACVMVPTILSLYWERLNPKGVFWGVLVAFFIGLPLFIYSNIIDKPVWIVSSALFVVLITLVFCLAWPEKRNVRT